MGKTGASQGFNDPGPLPPGSFLRERGGYGIRVRLDFRHKAWDNAGFDWSIDLDDKMVPGAAADGGGAGFDSEPSHAKVFDDILPKPLPEALAAKTMQSISIRITTTLGKQ